MTFTLLVYIDIGFSFPAASAGMGAPAAGPPGSPPGSPPRDGIADMGPAERLSRLLPKFPKLLLQMVHMHK